MNIIRFISMCKLFKILRSLIYGRKQIACILKHIWLNINVCKPDIPCFLLHIYIYIYIFNFTLLTHNKDYGFERRRYINYAF